MVSKIKILLIAAILSGVGLALATEFYKFPQVPAGQDRDVYLLRRPATAGFDNNTGSRNITGASLRAFANRSTATKDHQHVPVTYNPASMAVQNGTLDAGTAADLAAVGGTTVAVAEAAGTPALRIQLTYTGVAAVNNITIYGRYQGSTSHEIAVQAWNVTANAWVTLGLMATSTTNQWYSYPLINGADYISAGTVLLRCEHLQSGNPAHDLYLDYAVVRYASDATGGGVTDHGSLTGLTAHDDHTQYALTDGSRGAFPTLPQFTGYSTATQTKLNAKSNTGHGHAATEISYTNPTYTTVGAALDQLLYVAPGSPSVSGGGTYETGQTITSVALTWTIALGNKPLTSQSIDQGIGALNVADRAYTHNGQNITSNRTYTVSITDGTTPRSGNTTVAFSRRRHWGASTKQLASFTSGDILTLGAPSNEFSTSHSKSVTYDCTGGRYPTFAFVATAGTLTATTVGGLAFSDYSYRTISHTNASGSTTNYYVYQFNNIQTGAAVAVVWD